MSEEEKKLAIDLFNKVWELLDKENRSEEEDYLMVHMAHASLYHWFSTGSPENIFIGEWQISRVYAVLNNSESCLFHGNRALKICKDNDLTGFHLSYAYEALARAFLIKDNKSETTKYLELALKEAQIVKEPENKELLDKDLDELQRKIQIHFMS